MKKENNDLLIIEPKKVKVRIAPEIAYTEEAKKELIFKLAEAEVIDPETLEILPEGSEGELVFTTITKEGFPLIRYRTGDISSIIKGHCGCGRTTRLINRVSGRTDDMIIVDGNNIFPSQIEALLFEIEGVEPHFQIILNREEGLDVIELKVEVSSSVFAFINSSFFWVNLSLTNLIAVKS
jgi:phenylacetate-coenzyme A ligase PaaK-like adenylate-forming protein